MSSPCLDEPQTNTKERVKKWLGPKSNIMRLKKIIKEDKRTNNDNKYVGLLSSSYCEECIGTLQLATTHGWSQISHWISGLDIRGKDAD